VVAVAPGAADRDDAGPDPVPGADGPPAGVPDRPVSDVQPSDPTVRDVPPPDLPADPDPAAAEPPEEESDPAVAGIVAALPDEVLVIDEQPRYHLDGCRAVAARPVIPLPVGEAVELGFTPCAWCAPDRTLAERHRAAAP
jgi:hypothetical protein